MYKVSTKCDRVTRGPLVELTGWNNRFHVCFFLIEIHPMQGWNCHYEAQSYTKKKHKKVTPYRKSV